MPSSRGAGLEQLQTYLTVLKHKRMVLNLFLIQTLHQIPYKVHAVQVVLIL